MQWIRAAAWAVPCCKFDRLCRWKMAWRYWLLRQPRSLHLFTSPLEREIDITGFFQSLFYTKVVSGQQLNMDDCEYVRYVLSFTRNICISRHCEIALRIRRSLCHSKLMHCFTRACVAWLKLAKSGGQRPPPSSGQNIRCCIFWALTFPKRLLLFTHLLFQEGIHTWNCRPRRGMWRRENMTTGCSRRRSRCSRHRPNRSRKSIDKSLDKNGRRFKFPACLSVQSTEAEYLAAVCGISALDNTLVVSYKYLVSLCHVYGRETERSVVPRSTFF